MKRNLASALVVFLICFSFFTGNLLAANAIPKPVVPCSDSDFEDPEFNSQRPYQASPCLDAPKAEMCSNIIKVTIDHLSCNYNGNDTCTYTGGERSKRVVIDLSDVKLPILGNTQNVANSETGTDGFDDAQKLNEYVNWYLNGATQKAEYGLDDKDKTINFSGPAKKLLPSVQQDLFRFKVIRDASDTKEEGTPETGNHNQIAVCTKDNFLNKVTRFFGLDHIWFGPDQPVPCYDGGGKKANDKKMRLVQWWDDKFVGYKDSFNLIGGWDGSVAWRFRIPPFPWQFSEPVYYEKAYKEWRGGECLFDTLLNTLVGQRLLCIDARLPGVVDLHTNIWADSYQYVPLSNPVDKVGKENFGSVTLTLDGTFSKDESKIDKVPQLFFPHAVGVSESISNLNKTFVPIEGVDTSAIPELTEENTASCQILDVRTNEGDDLTFDNTKAKHQIDFTSTYTVDQIKCKQTGMTRPIPVPFGTPIPPKPIYDCSTDITASINLTTQAPHLEDIWENTTGGAGSAFRKIFPKVEEGAPVSCVADIPGVSSATYALNPDSSSGVGNLDVKNPTTSTATSPEIYFPHLGSVYEYFLKGIQTALRPQGYGEPITNGTTCIPAVACGEWESKLAGSGGACGICNAPIGNLAKQILTAAGTAHNVPASNIWAAMLHEGGDWSEFGGFSDANVRKWSNSVACGGEPMPRCDNTADATQAPFGFLKHWFYLGDGNNALWKAVQLIDPSRNSKEKVSRCNFLDAAYAAAKLLQQSASNTTAGISCGSYSGFTTVGPGTCSSSFWNDTKVAQSQTGYAGYCVNGPYYTIEDAVGWHNSAKCN